MKYILFLILTAHQGAPSQSTTEFASEDACKRAGYYMEMILIHKKGVSPNRILVYCAPKG